MKKTLNYLFVILSFMCLLSLPTSIKNVNAKSLSLQSENNEIEKNEKLIRYDFLAEDEMPILGYIGIPSANAGSGGNAENPSFITKSNVERYKDAGFNILSGLYDREPFHTSEIHKALELCNELGITYFVNDNAIRCETAKGALPSVTYNDALNHLQDSWYLNEDGFGGVAVKDEPTSKDFESIGNVTKALKKANPGKMVYSTLFPVYVHYFGLAFDDVTNDIELALNGGTWKVYERYVKEYMKQVNPDMLCYDLYVSMREDGTLDNPLASKNANEIASGRGNINDYFKSLSIFRNVAKQYNTPFCPTVASYNHITQNQYTEKQLNWVVNTSLAYGAKGIQYYTYWPDMENSKVEGWENPVKRGLVTQNGTPHDTYYQIKNINDNIKKVQKVLMTSEHIGIMQLGKQNYKVELEDVLYNYDVLNNITGGDTFVGCFKKPDGKTAYYIVNNSINAGITTFKADLYKKSNIRLTNLANGVQEFKNAFSVGFNLSGGQAILLEVM